MFTTMSDSFDSSPYQSLIDKASASFLTDTGYSISVARAAGTLVARRKVREDALAEDTEGMVE